MTSRCAEVLRRCLGATLLALAVPAVGVDFAPAEVGRIVAHGPWPPAWQGDPGNRVSGQRAAQRLGYLLFFEPRLSANSRVSCASCHEPRHAFQDARATGRGLAEGTRNTPGLWNVRWQRWFGWDGGHDSLWAASLRPIVDPAEMGGDARRTARVLQKSRELSCLYRQSFGREPRADDAELMVNVAKALAAWQEMLVAPPTAFDDFRAALERGDTVAAQRYPEAARRGLKLFLGRGQCATCHAGPLFTNGEFADIGLHFFIRGGGADPGRQGGIKRLLASPWNLLGAHNDDPTRANTTGTLHLRPEHRNFGEFKVPSLRNLRLTAPYMHHGRLATLHDVVRHYSEFDEERLHSDGERILKALHLGEADSADLVAFLESLSSVEAPPLPVAPRVSDCTR